MWKKIWQIGIFSLLVSLAAIIQFSLVPAWPGFWAHINLGLVILIFSLFFFNFRSALLSVFVFGFWLDALSFRFFGFYILTLFLTLAPSAWLLRDRLTNRSLYSFSALILAATWIYNLSAAILFEIFETNQATFFLFRGDFWKSGLYQSAWNLMAAIFFFHLATALTKRLNPFFLEKGKRL